MIFGWGDQATWLPSFELKKKEEKRARAKQGKILVFVLYYIIHTRAWNIHCVKKFLKYNGYIKKIIDQF